MSEPVTQPIIELSREFVTDKFDPETLRKCRAVVNGWLARGDGIAVYENQNLGSPLDGHIKFVSFGSSRAQLETDRPPQRMPDIGGDINWAYQLLGTYKGAAL